MKADENVKIVEGRRDPFPFVRIFFALIIATLAFSMIFMVSYTISYYNYQGVSVENNLIEEYLKDLRGRSQSVSCDASLDDELLYGASVKLDQIGSRIAILESRFGKTDYRVLEQKELYTALEIEHFNIVNELKSKCGADFITILFFYSNLELDDRDKRSETMGFVLSAFKKEELGRIMVYSFDFDLDSELIDELESEYGVNQAPIVVVNKLDLVNVHNIEDLLPYLKK